jgi:hypothetical protein
MVEPTHAWAKRLDSRPVVRPSIRTAVVPTGHLLPQISRATRAVDLRGQPSRTLSGLPLTGEV